MLPSAIRNYSVLQNENYVTDPFFAHNISTKIIFRHRRFHAAAILKMLFTINLLRNLHLPSIPNMQTEQSVIMLLPNQDTAMQREYRIQIYMHAFTAPRLRICGNVLPLPHKYP
jgi:hypothetical protein